jgi:mono/diheme cytochrome c family protein
MAWMAMPATAQQQAAISDQALIGPGKTTYAQKCSHCHGFNMVNAGTIAPDLRRFPDDRERFFTTVKLGKNGKMPPWGDLLSDDQIACLWTYVASRRNP